MPAMIAAQMPVMAVINNGVPVRGLTRARARGRRPSRAITKKMRLWPYMNTMMTLGSATMAAAPTRVAASGWLRPRRMKASGSALLASAPAGRAPIAAAATSI